MIMRFKTKLSNFEFVNVWIGLLAFVFVHFLEEFSTLVEFYVRVGVQIIFILFCNSFGLEFS